jgi:hypothetical protein
MSVKRRDLVKYLEENGFTLLREGKKHSFTPRETGRSPSKGIERLTGSRPMNCANRQG